MSRLFIPAFNIVWFSYLRLSLQCGGIIVDINVSNHSTIISFSDYYDGAAPALLINHTPWATISYRQRSDNTVCTNTKR